MIGAGEPPTPSGAVPRERGWRWVLVSLVLATAVTFVAQWPPSLALLAVLVQFVVPVPAVLSLVLAAVGACAVAAWVRGGAIWPALLSAGALLAAVWLGAPRGGAVSGFTAGWIVLLAGSFGWVQLGVSARAFIERALGALVIAGVVVACVVSLPTRGGVGGWSDLGTRWEQELEGRRSNALAQWQERMATPSWQSMGARFPSTAQAAERTAAWLVSAVLPTRVLPALLLLESLAALALAWSLWHRFTRTRLGPPLARLTEFRFSDHLVWAVVLGAGLVLVPVEGVWRVVGANLLVVSGALYALRGLGVLLWLVPDRVLVGLLVLVCIAVPLLGPVQVLATVALLALGLGLGDTWRDFRRSAAPVRSEPRP